MERKPKSARLPTAAQAKAEARWVAENANAFDCWNAYIAKHGLPLAQYWDHCPMDSKPN